ncbi:MAG TPA: hypothetical protein VIM56_13960 [Rhizomicrobium sp.]
MRRAVLLLLLALGGCADPNPPAVELSARFTPPSADWLTAHNALTPAAMKGACAIRLVEVRDARADMRSMGTIGARMIDEPDSVAWMRSGFDTLKRDARISFADGGKAMDLKVEILKAYMLSITEAKTTNIVVRIDYGGAQPEGVYRGTDTGLNWASGSGETQSSFDRAMAQLMASIDEDIVARCARM